MQRRKLVESIAVLAFLMLLMAMPIAVGQSPATGGIAAAAADPGRLVREVVYNELHDHESHGYWRYWIERQASGKTMTREQIETREGPVDRLQLANGLPLPASAQEEENRRLLHLISSPAEQEQHRKEYAEDEHRIGRILALLPEAFTYEIVEPQTLDDNLCYHLRFQPKAGFPAHSIEARIFHAMTGELWIGVRTKHLVRLDGRLEDNVDFGYGLLGRLYKGGWFRLDRTRVTAGTGNGDWKTQRLEVHMSGRAMLFKTIAHETSEVRGGFEPVPTGLSLQQAVSLMSGVTTAANVQRTTLTSTQFGQH